MNLPVETTVRRGTTASAILSPAIAPPTTPLIITPDPDFKLNKSHNTHTMNHTSYRTNRNNNNNEASSSSQEEGEASSSSSLTPLTGKLPQRTSPSQSRASSVPSSSLNEIEETDTEMMMEHVKDETEPIADTDRHHDNNMNNHTVPVLSPILLGGGGGSSSSSCLCTMMMNSMDLHNKKNSSKDNNHADHSNSNTATTSNSLLPQWYKPTPSTITHNPGLCVLNSLTRTKDELITSDGSPRLTWYMCGPTVYAPSHMGHARTYLGFDILRRILQYFRYHITLIMNITDLDDKIIERSAEQGLHHLELSRHFEREFFLDMAQLGVLLPTCITRVTEYMPDIVQYIGRIVHKKLAYESNGSVYFHVQAFEAIQPYCKLAPEQIHNAALLAEGEGKLTQAFGSDKRSPRDFALWKKSKAGEPAWPSPWGLGRPGWHIECSVMASDVLKRLTGQPCMDVHSGGVDLKFPHHDNEMAQAEAECGSRQWVNYFVHSGHLHIKGLKMSKSLKNFITIQQALEINSARQIRMLFLLHRYNASMDYGDNTMSRATQHEKVFVEFFHNAKACLRAHPTHAVQKWNAATVQLQHSLSRIQMAVDDALKDDFDTPAAIALLVELVKATNVYMESPTTAQSSTTTSVSSSSSSSSSATPFEGGIVGTVVYNVASYITRMFQVFGLITNHDGIGFSDSNSSSSSTSCGGVPGCNSSGGFAAAESSSSREHILAPVLDAVMTFRSTVRENARGKKVDAVLDECDAFRDTALPPLGIRLEDKAEGRSIWKLADPAELLLEMQQRQAETERKAEDKARRDAEDVRKANMAKLPPMDYMRQVTSEDGMTLAYSQFDETGMPTHDNSGEPLNKNQVKKAAKLFKTQQSKYDKFVKSLSPATTTSTN